MIAPCLHCKRPKYILARGLCHSCYMKPARRALYPLLDEQGRSGRREPTDEELDAMIAQQMQRLPEWWPAPKPEEPPRVEIVIVRDPTRTLRKPLP